MMKLKRRNMLDYLPQEVLMEILARLPVKSLLQVRCVCKTWCCLISSSAFIAHHLNVSTTRSSGLVFFRYRAPREHIGAHERYLLCLDESFPHYYVEEFHCPFESISRSYLNIVGHCNGMLCLSGNFLAYDSCYALWNPSIRRVVITAPNTTFKTHGRKNLALAHGFGFDPLTNDYKLVQVAYLEDSRSRINKVLFLVPPVVEVYSLRSRNWRMVSNDLNFAMFVHEFSSFFNGACHWLLHSQDKSHVWIMLFHLGNELFREMAMPNGFDWEDCSNTSIAVCNGYLGLIPYKKSARREHYSVWVMKKYGDVGSWTRLWNFEHVERVNRVLAFRKDGKILFARGEDGSVLTTDKAQLVCFDPKTKEKWNYNIWGMVGSFYVDTFVESLALFNEHE